MSGTKQPTTSDGYRVEFKLKGIAMHLTKLKIGTKTLDALKRDTPKGHIIHRLLAEIQRLANECDWAMIATDTSREVDHGESRDGKKRVAMVVHEDGYIEVYADRGVKVQVIRPDKWPYGWDKLDCVSRLKAVHQYDWRSQADIMDLVHAVNEWVNRFVTVEQERQECEAFLRLVGRVTSEKHSATPTVADAHPKKPTRSSPSTLGL